MTTNYYDVLEISKDATDEQIKQAYRNLAKQHHPDKKGGNKEKFQKIQEAYDILYDKHKKNEYDNKTNENIFEQFSSGFSFFNNFANFFNQKIKKNDHIHKYSINLENVYFGIKKQFNLKKSIECKLCKKKCDACNGLGRTEQKIQVAPNIIQGIQHPCKICNTTGKIRNLTCDKCNSTGFIVEEKRIEIDIPKGVENGKKFIFQGWGEQATNSNEISGDFIIEIHVEEHPLLKRHGLDLIHTERITLKDSIVGKNISIPYFNSIIHLNIKSFGIIDPNKKYGLDDRGLESNNKKGKLYINFTILYPDVKLNDEQISNIKDIFEKFKI